MTHKPTGWPAPLPEDWDKEDVGYQHGATVTALEPRKKGLTLRRTTELRLPPPTQWLGKGWLPRSEIAVLVGAEGIGKSLTWVKMAAHVTTGRPFSAFNMPKRNPSDVVIIVTEDSASEVEARLRVAGADLNRIHFFCAEDDGSGTPIFTGGDGGDMLLLHGLIDQMDDKPSFLVVDAWLDTVAGNLNIRDTQQARQALHPWKNLAARHNLAVLLVTHTNRMDTANTRDLMGGTAALRQKARMVLFAARRPLQEGERQHLWIGPDKANTTGIVDAVKFNVQVEQVRPQTDDDPGTTALLTSPQSALMTIGQLLGEWKREEQEADRKPTKAKLAEDVIREYMAEQEGDVLSGDVKEHLRDAGFGKSATEQAMRDLGTSTPSGKGGKWLFVLEDPKSPYPAPAFQNSSESKKTRKSTNEQP